MAYPFDDDYDQQQYTTDIGGGPYPEDTPTFNIPAMRPRNIFDDFMQNQVAGLDMPTGFEMAGPDPNLVGGPAYNTPIEMDSPTPRTPMRLGMGRVLDRQTRIPGYDLGPITQLPLPDYDNAVTDPDKLYKEWYTPEHTATDWFNRISQQYPQHEKPGLLRGLAAMAVSAGKGGYKAGQEVLDAPFKEKYEDWKAQITPAYQAANLERQSNANERMLAYQRASLEGAKRREIETERKNRATEENRAKRTAVYAWAAKPENQKRQLIFPKGGNVMTVNPGTGQYEAVLDEQGNPIPTGTLSDEDRYNLQGQWQKEAQMARERLEITRQTGAAEKVQPTLVEGPDGLAYSYPGTPDHPEARLVPIPGSKGYKRVGTEREPTERGAEDELTKRFMRAQELMRDPEFSKWVHAPNKNEVKVDQPKPGYLWDSGPSQDIFNRANDYITKGIPPHQQGPTPENLKRLQQERNQPAAPPPPAARPAPPPTARPQGTNVIPPPPPPVTPPPQMNMSPEAAEMAKTRLRVQARKREIQDQLQGITSAIPQAAPQPTGEEAAAGLGYWNQKERELIFDPLERARQGIFRALKPYDIEALQEELRGLDAMDKTLEQSQRMLPPARPLQPAQPTQPQQPQTDTELFMIQNNLSQVDPTRYNTTMVSRAVQILRTAQKPITPNNVRAFIDSGQVR